MEETALKDTPTALIVDVIEDTASEEGDTPTVEEEKPKHPRRYYQGIGDLFGLVAQYEEEGKKKTVIELLGQDKARYGLTGAPKVLKSLSLELAKSAAPSPLWLKVYPKYHVGTKSLYFQVVGYSSERPADVIPGVFTLRGNFQFIPQVRGPVISVYRNIDQLKRIKESPKGLEGTKLGTHLPLIWRESPVKPYRFMKGAKDNYSPFVEIKARLIPMRGCFGFVSLLEEPTTYSPRRVKKTKPEKKNFKKNDGDSKPIKKESAA